MFSVENTLLSTSTTDFDSTHTTRLQRVMSKLNSVTVWNSEKILIFVFYFSTINLYKLCALTNILVLISWA